MKRAVQLVLSASFLLTAGLASAASEKLYSVEASAAQQELAAGAKGSISLEIKGKEGAYVSPEAPLKVTVSGTNVKLEKEKLSRGDLPDKTSKSPKFVVPFTAGEKGSASVDADVTFFICTANLCERQVQKVSVPLTVK